ncbi:hypothetical protein GCM10011414_19560 [Croceivirga lutea]|uniref:hypothetical protein n=1 Tax=Croceivirga lutea TaxID=1775167 RepID=UPI00163B6172|nr:hypothetical protein [Croceivirga lutea]GGG49848.1 hypothetical protein GCM10011414_19560 [Croceivirga lutea]
MKRFIFLTILSLSVYSNAQDDCNLGVGGGHHEEIIKFFQLDSIQQEKLKNWGAELEFRNEIFRIRAKSLLETHAQSSPEDLLKLSLEYRVLLDSMRANLRLLDKRLLGTFNDKQYNLYVEMCNSINRSPIYSTRLAVEKK